MEIKKVTKRTYYILDILSTELYPIYARLLNISPYVFIASEQICMIMIMKGVACIKQNTDDLLTHLLLDKRAAILQTIFSDEFSWMKSFYFDQNFNEVCSYESNWQKHSIGLDTGFVANRRQAIICINADPIHWRIYVPLVGAESIPPHDIGILLLCHTGESLRRPWQIITVVMSYTGVLKPSVWDRWCAVAISYEWEVKSSVGDNSSGYVMRRS